MIDLLEIQTAGTDAPAGSLSGGNQQKVVIAKWLMAEPRIILLNDPTRGIDVGTKQEIYALLRRLADQGAAIVFYTTDYDELIGCCDRALVLYNGAIRRELAGAEITERALIASALNISSEERRGRSAGAMSDWRYRLAQNRGTLLALAFLRRDVRDLHEQPSGRLQRQCRADRRQQGRAAGAGGDGPDLRRHHRRHRSFGRHGVRSDQLPCVVDRGRNRGERHARRPRRSFDRRRLRGDQRAHRHLWPAAADRRHHCQRRGVFRPRSAFASGSGRRRVRAAGRRADRARFRRLAREPDRARRRRSRCLGSL